MIWKCKNALTFFILFILYQSYVASKQCSGPRTVNQDVGVRLKGHAFITTKQYGAKIQCVEECLARSGHCVSINFNQKTSLCELNDKTESSFPLSHDPDFIYTDMQQYYFLIGECAKHRCPRDERCVELPNGSPMCFRMYLPCNSNPCLNSATCINDRTSYTCECPDKYSGSHCEILEPPWISFGNSLYLIEEQHKSWENAKAYCESKQAKLVEIESQEENTFIKNTLIQRNGLNSAIKYWTGGNDLFLEGQYEWVSSRQKIEFTDWAQNQPKSNNYRQNCIQIMYKNAWDDALCELKKYFICENQ